MIYINDVLYHKVDFGDPDQHQKNNSLRQELVKAVGGPNHLHKDAGKWVSKQIDDDQLHRYDSVEDMIEAVNEANVLWRENDSKGLGPSKIGPRPPFRDEAANFKTEVGTDRRHVISCSTLGKAVEKSEGSLQEVRDFVTRHKGRPLKTTPGDTDPSSPNFLVPGSSQYQKADHEARREAWKIVNSHMGNLWPGPRGDNRAAGFIRGPLHAARDTINENGALTGQEQGDLLRQLRDRPQGPLYADGKKSWKTMGGVMAQDIESQERIRQGHPLGDEPTIADQELVDDLHELEKNADLDLPAIDQNKENVEMGGTDYYLNLTSVYQDMRDAAESVPDSGKQVPNLFTPNGTLDRYMALDLNQINSVRMAPLREGATLRPMLPPALTPDFGTAPAIPMVDDAVEVGNGVADGTQQNTIQPPPPSVFSSVPFNNAYGSSSSSRDIDPSTQQSRPMVDEMSVDPSSPSIAPAPLSSLAVDPSNTPSQNPFAHQSPPSLLTVQQQIDNLQNQRQRPAGPHAPGTTGALFIPKGESRKRSTEVAELQPLVREDIETPSTDDDRSTRKRYKATPTKKSTDHSDPRIDNNKGPDHRPDKGSGSQRIIRK